MTAAHATETLTPRTGTHAAHARRKPVGFWGGVALTLEFVGALLLLFVLLGSIWVENATRHHLDTTWSESNPGPGMPTIKYLLGANL